LNFCIEEDTAARVKLPLSIDTPALELLKLRALDDVSGQLQTSLLKKNGGTNLGRGFDNIVGSSSVGTLRSILRCLF
jgi:hypothetical protein